MSRSTCDRARPPTRAAAVATIALAALLRLPVGTSLAWPTTPPGGQATARRASLDEPARRNIAYSEAQALFGELRPELLPRELRQQSDAARGLMWSAWVSRRESEIRGRLTRGNEDSIVNLLFFGTRFTGEPRVRSGDLAVLDNGDLTLERRLGDLIQGVVSPGANGRLRFVRILLERQGIDVTTAAGRASASSYLRRITRRYIQDHARYDRAFQAAKTTDDVSAQLFTQSTLYQDRGLSSDTSIFPDFALEQALAAIRDANLTRSGPIRQVGIVGPGLDFADKDDGYDFYPQQTVQVFAVIDSLVRLGLARPEELAVAAFDVNPRVTEHLEAARLRAHGAEPYVVQLARNTDEHWTDNLLTYWRRFGTAIGEMAVPIHAPANAGNVEVHAAQFAPTTVLSIHPRDLNIVLERLDTSGFDLIVATNVLVYYDVFEQGLALSNISRMLRPGGLFLTNTPMLSSDLVRLVGSTDTPYTDRGDGDRIWWYQRR